jgi:RNA polymerase sigma-70 factor (ECF subfamily)
LERVSRGDQAAFGVLVARHEKALRAFLGRVAGADAADELAQQSFVKAWQSAGRFRGEAGFSTWLHAIAWRCFLDSARAGRREARKREAAADLGDDVEAPSSEPRLDLARALERLAPVERAALVLCEGHGWSHGEAAAILSIPLGTLKSHVLRAKRKCRAMLS